MWLEITDRTTAARKSTSRFTNPHSPSLDPAHNICSVSAGGSQLGTARHGDNAFKITHILVIGIENGNGIQPVQPAAYYSAFGVKEYAI